MSYKAFTFEFYLLDCMFESNFGALLDCYIFSCYVVTTFFFIVEKI